MQNKQQIIISNNNDHFNQQSNITDNHNLDNIQVNNNANIKSNNSRNQDHSFQQQNHLQQQSKQIHKSENNSYENIHQDTSDAQIPNNKNIKFHNQNYQGTEFVQKQNIQLKKRNHKLKNQLQKINLRLQLQLQKKKQQNQIKANMELKNAYKRCDIMKKQLNILKKKDLSFGDDKYNHIQFALRQKSKENDQLKNQIKSLKNINKFQQKGLIQLGSKEFIDQATQMQKIKNQNKKLHAKVQQLQRIVRLQQLSTKNQRRMKYSLAQKDIFHKQQLKNRIDKDVKLLRNVQQRDSNKMKYLTFEKNRQIQIIDNLKMQVSQRDNQIKHLKQVIANLRKIARDKKSSNGRRIHTQAQIQSLYPSGQESKSNIQKQNKVMPEKLNEQNQKEQNIETNSVKNQQVNEEIQESNHKSLNNLIVKYPRMQQRGQKNQMGFKWNHHSFSSKIKQIQILPHQNGHIKAIHIRYQKGQPTKVQGQYSSFVCQEFKQYIKNISGGFKNGFLQFLIVTTNQKRVNKFCRYDLQDECTKFSFNIRDNEYPCALFGQNIEQGVIRFGCFIQKLNENQK